MQGSANGLAKRARRTPSRLGLATAKDPLKQPGRDGSNIVEEGVKDRYHQQRDGVGFLEIAVQHAFQLGGVAAVDEEARDSREKALASEDGLPSVWNGL